MTRCAVVIPAGPGPEELARVDDLLDALGTHEPRATAHVVVVDDGERSSPAPAQRIANPRAGRGIGTLGGTVSATLAGLAWAREHAPGAWVLRLDTDALVVGPFLDRIDDALQPGDGVLGSCHRTCNGDPRDHTGWAKEVRRHQRPVWTWRHPPRRPAYVRPAPRFVRELLAEATANGYAPGEHCLAAGCAISPALIEAAHARGWLESPERWTHARLGDDIVLGAMARAAGLDLKDEPTVFGLKHVGLADSPQGLLDRGFGVVHSLKNDPHHPEPELRAFFAKARA